MSRMPHLANTVSKAALGMAKLLAAASCASLAAGLLNANPTLIDNGAAGLLMSCAVLPASIWLHGLNKNAPH